MTTEEWLTKATNQLTRAGIGSARLDCLILLEDETRKDRSWLLAHPEEVLDSKHEAILQKLLSKRERHVPLAYVRGKTEFYGHEFVVNDQVLEPRPETESMLELLKKLALMPQNKQFDARNARIADVGTGSGAIGISAAIELKNGHIDLIDIDSKALKVAKTNVDKFTLKLSLICSDLLAATDKDYQILLCNLPYVPDGFHINLAATHEPRLAIFGGLDGLDVYRHLFDQVKKLKLKPLYILTEALPPQHDELAALAAASGYKVDQVDGFVQAFSLNP